MADEPYSKVTRRVWADEKFRGLSAPKPNAQTLWLYLLTGARCTSIPGLIAVGVMGLAEDLSWSITATRKCLAEIERAGMAKVDHVARLIWLPNAIRHNVPANQSIVLGWARKWVALPRCELLAEAAISIRETLMAEDDRRRTLGRPDGLAVAFAVVLGEVTMDAAGVVVGRPVVAHRPPVERAVFRRDGNACRYCRSHSFLSIDHVVPRCQGGDDDIENLALACKKCNSRKNGRTPEEAGMALLPAPPMGDQQ
jgi:hypothetical protein